MDGFNLTVFQPESLKALALWKGERYKPNPKVIPLVNALNAAGFVTTMSGDLYSDDLIYVDLGDKHADWLSMIRLPDGWILTWTSVQACYASLRGKEFLPTRYHDRVRLIRRDVPTDEQIHELISSLTKITE